MATRNKRKFAALNKENCEEHPRSNLLVSVHPVSPTKIVDVFDILTTEISSRQPKIVVQNLEANPC